MSKKVQWICSVILVLIMGITVGSYFEARSNEVVTYNFDVIDYDFIVRDFTLVTFKDKYYIPKGYKIEKRNSSKGKISDIEMKLSQEEKEIRNYVFGFEYNQEYESSMDELWDSRTIGRKIKADKSLEIKFKYTIDGEEKENTQSIELEEHIKQKL